MKYLVDENETIGSNRTRSHGPNSVIFMLDNYLAHHGKSEPVLSFHADNCAGQNRNKSVIAYFAWHILHQTSDSSLKNSWAAYGPGNSNRLEIDVID